MATSTSTKQRELRFHAARLQTEVDRRLALMIQPIFLEVLLRKRLHDAR
jgi:hypothetical protein